MTQAPSLWTKHRRWAIGISRSYFADGHEAQDIEQEALIGLWDAARRYDPEKGPFKRFAALVITRRLIEVVRHSNKIKNRIVSDAERDYDPPARPLGPDRETLETLHRIVDGFGTLSRLERLALTRSLNGDPIVSKSYDNALQRARRKLRLVA